MYMYVYRYVWHTHPYIYIYVIYMYIHIYLYICPAYARQSTPASCCIVPVFAKKTVILSASMVSWQIHPRPPSSMLNTGIRPRPFG